MHLKQVHGTKSQRESETSTCCWGWWRYQILAAFKNVYYQRRCGTTILPSFHCTAHSEAVLKAGGSKCLRMPNMASQNPENSVGETRCWTILIYPYLILFISSMFLHKLFWALFSNKRSTRTSTPVSSLPKATFRLSCAKCYVSKGESPRERTDVLKETYEQTALWSCLILQNLQIPEGNCLI